jgi:hypothetical protein
MRGSVGVDLYDAPADMDPSEPTGQLALVLSPLTLYAFTSGSYQALASLEGAPPPPLPATETAQGIVELATAAETATGTDNTRAVHPAGFKAAITPTAFIAPVLLASWINFGAPAEAAGHRKTPWGEVQLRGTIKGGTTTNGTVLFNLPAGYRPANERRFPAMQGGASVCLIYVSSNGDVLINGLTNNAYLSLDSVRFEV